MNKNQKGFGLIAVLLLIIILVIIGAGVAIWRHNHTGLKISYSGVPNTFDGNTKFPTSTKPQTVKTTCFEVILPGNFKVQKNGTCDIGAARGADGAVLTITSETGELASVEAKYKQKMGTRNPISERDTITKEGLKAHVLEQESDASSQYGIWQQIFIIKTSSGWLVQNGDESNSSKGDNIFQNIVDSITLKS